MNNVRAICLDLDDTLWDLKPVIPRAEKALYEWYGEYFPRVIEVYTRDDVLKLRMTTAQENPHLRHDLTTLRMMVLRKIAADAGYDETMADEAFRVFDQERNNVELFADVLPALSRLNNEFRLLSLSNGNSCLQRIGIAHFFHESYSARELGYAKPDAAIFLAVCEREKLMPKEILHVGDHPENDIVGAQRAGMPAAWVNRDGKEWEDDRASPETIVACLEELADELGA